MSTTVELEIPSCDVELIETISAIQGVPWARIITAAMLCGLCELSAMTAAPTPEQMQQWCDRAHTLIGDALYSIE